MKIGTGVFLIWASYTIGIWGYCLVKAYDVPFSALFGSTWPGAAPVKTAATAGHSLGTISGSTQVTDPGQLQSELGA